MAYKKYVWIDEESPLNAENLNNIENGINELMNGEFIIDIYGTKVNLNLNPDTNLFTISLLSNSGKILDTKSIILNSSGDTLKECFLDDTNKRLIFTLTSGAKVYCDLTVLYDKFNNYVTNEKFENLVKVTPTGININSNNELYLEHDGKEITGQTKKVKIANLDDTDKLPIMSDIANVVVTETLQYENIKGNYPRRAIPPNVIVSNNMEINTETNVIRTLINAASENVSDYGNIQPLYTSLGYVYVYRANDNTKNIHEIRMRSAFGDISNNDNPYVTLYSSEYGVYEPFVVYDESQSNSNKNFTVYVYFSEETENKLLQNIKYVKVKISLSNDSKIITPTILSSGIAISGENQLNDKENVVQYSRPGFSVIARLADASYLMVLETNINNSIGYPYVIQYCYSKDYINWTTPKTLFKSKGSLINIPYVDTCWDSRIAISYHTNMDYIGIKDSSIHNKMMHVMLSSISIKYGMSLESNMFGELFMADGRQYKISESPVSKSYTTVGTYNLWTGGWGSLYYYDKTINILYGSNYTKIAGTSFPTNNTLFVKKVKKIANTYVPLKNTKGVYAMSDDGKESILLNYATGADGTGLINSLAYRTSGGFLYAATPTNLNPNINPNLIATKRYVGNYVDSKLVNIYTFKGSVNTYNDLPKNAKNGDVYDIKKSYESYPAGTNFAWTGEKWDSLGGIIDLSNYVTQTNLTNILNNYVTNTYLSQTLTDYVSNDALTGILNSYATTASLNNHINNKSNPHGVTKTQIGLENVDNTSDQNKPVSTAQQTAINNTGHTLNIVDNEIQLLNANSEILSKQILPKLELAELNTIYYNIDGTLTDEQVTYLQSFKNLMFLKVKYNEASASAIDIFLSKVRTVGTSQIVFTFNHSSGNMNIGFAANSLLINLSSKKYTWSTTSVGVITDHNIHYDVNGTLMSSTLSAINEFADSAGNLLLHLIIGGMSSAGYTYLTYTSHEILSKTKITFISDGYKKLVINLTDGSYTFEVSQIAILPITQSDYDSLSPQDNSTLYIIEE